MVTLFWISAAVVGYVYVAYPMLLMLYCKLRKADCGFNRSINPQSSIRHPQYTISIVLAARNEAARLPARIENLLSLDYPADRRQIIVVSDGSTDDTLSVLAPFSRSVTTVAVPAGGKALALNVGVARASGDIVVFADARQTFARDALRELTAPFADSRVGAVTGALRIEAAGSTIGEGVGLYWTYETALRRLESAIDSTLGATGAIYAMRRSLFKPLPADTILDDVLTPMRVVLQGHRVVFNERARAFDRAASDEGVEARRKVRTLAGNYQILALEPRLLLPWRNRVWLQYVSHKLGRLVVPYALLASFAASLALTAASPFYAFALAAQVIVLLLAGGGALLELKARPIDRAFVTESRIPREAA